MRVVAGSAKGRKLKSPKNPGTRPVMDRVKTALFDILSPRIVDATFLDLFAGTGSIGIEALSRGATSATFIEMAPDIVKLVHENLRITGLADHAEVLRADAFKFLASAATSHRHFDIVYVAPPQYQEMAVRALHELDTHPLTPPDGLVILQVHPAERGPIDALPLTHYERSDERKYGSTLLLFYEPRAAHTEDDALPADADEGHPASETTMPEKEILQ